MKNNNQHIDDTLLTKFLSGETHKDEQKMLISWLEGKKENRERLDQLEQVWLESGKLKPRPIFVNKVLAWSKLSDRIKQHEKTASASIQGYSRFRVALISSVAASILVLIGLFNWYVDDASQRTDFLLANTSQSSLQDSLPDGSEIYLNPHAEISYQETTNLQRIVKLKGEAFFNVKRDTLRPFIIQAGVGGVKVLGTSFQVKIKENGDIAVEVRSGRVELFRPNKTKTDTLHLILTKDEAGLISNQQDTIIRVASNSSAFFWLNKRLSFRNKQLKDVFQVLEACYPIEIKIDDPSIGELYYSSSFIDDEIEEIIQVISESFNLTYLKEEDTFTLFHLKKND